MNWGHFITIHDGGIESSGEIFIGKQDGNLHRFLFDLGSIKKYSFQQAELYPELGLDPGEVLVAFIVDGKRFKYLLGDAVFMFGFPDDSKDQ